MEMLDRDQTNRLLFALGSRLALARAHVELVVIGGSALIALRLVDRTTRNVDVVALLSGRELVSPKPLAPVLVEARNQVAADFGIDERWLNVGPPTCSNGDSPTASWTASRPEATAPLSPSTPPPGSIRSTSSSTRSSTRDRVVTRPTCALSPSDEELLAGARWTLTHDPSEGFRQELEAALRYLGVEDADLGA